ncbi:type VII secretion-associated serine protease mycosin [Streptomyces sp. TRM66268-LWL]|uniref:Type VII secretion-associated serine protease mycosin n=1 Tax=Streptomyces polyasparticus TaxID=2767826 RepID=A0ABR7S8H4_9ACTN|nr:type VII secretion-associated serine protease mycosin [Streptomyces polyasparticus]MBC9711766.1 type VII secretion-associated serine protease mycosin [Streptomyces polyasparticus]
MTYAMRVARKLAAGAAAAAVTCVTLTALPVLPASPAVADTTGQCTFGGEKFKGRPWALQRVLLDELWKEATGKGVRVAVIDTGVDVKNEQLKGAVDVRAGRNYIPKDAKDEQGNKLERGNEQGTTDTVGHGTKVAGIIAARPAKGTGFVGLAPGATIIPIQHNDAAGNGDSGTLATAIRYAVSARADVINISQDTVNPIAGDSALKNAVDFALSKNVVVVASAGNDGLGGNVKETYPAAFDGVLAVASSDRNNERAAFSQSGEFVDVAAPGVDMVSTVPGGGHCADNGTSFSAPYAAAVAALIKEKHADWKAHQIVAQIEQTAERSVAGHDRLVGWGVVDPVRALTEDDRPLESPVPHEGVPAAQAPEPGALVTSETPDERNARLATYVLIGGGVLVAAVAGGAVAYRDSRRRAARVSGGEV